MAREQTIAEPADDAAAFDALCAAFHGPLTSYLARLTGDRALADDLTQETLLRAYRALPRAPRDAGLRPWLYRIATNLARSHFRRQRLLRWLPLGVGPDEPADERAARRAEALDQRAAIEAALRQIGPGHASVLLLRHYQGLSLEETAAVLGITPNAAKTRLFRARHAFIIAWQDAEQPPDREPPA